MNQLTQAAFQSLDEIWGTIHEQSQEHAEPVYLASLWRMAGNICTGYALQHRTAQEPSSADTFEWLASICDERQLMALHPSALEQSEPRLQIVNTLRGLTH